MAMFTKRHYEAIAGILAARRRKIIAAEGSTPTLFSSIPDHDKLQRDLTNLFDRDNQRFKRWEFEIACRKQEG